MLEPITCTGEAAVGALLLAGGEGRRMGGCDKGWVLYRGQPLAAHVLSGLASQVGWLAISANRTLEGYAGAGCPVWADEASWQGMGPLAALATAAGQLPASIAWLQVAPCDTPHLPADLVQRLQAALRGAPDAVVAMPVTATGPQPACMLLRRQALESVGAYLANGGRSIRGWLAGLVVCEVLFDAAPFANANDPAALAALDQSGVDEVVQPGGG